MTNLSIVVFCNRNFRKHIWIEQCCIIDLFWLGYSCKKWLQQLHLKEEMWWKRGIAREEMKWASQKNWLCKNVFDQICIYLVTKLEEINIHSSLNINQSIALTCTFPFPTKSSIWTYHCISWSYFHFPVPIWLASQKLGLPLIQNDQALFLTHILVYIHFFPLLIRKKPWKFSMT